MKRYVEVTLIGETYTRDKNAEQVATTTETTVIGTLTSATTTEFYQAANAGYHPDVVVKVYAQEYAKQKRLRVDGVEYSLIRTYLSGDFIELHCQQKGADEDG